MSCIDLQTNRELKTCKFRVKAITLILRVMEQLAYTTGSHSHKEIHLSLDWIERNSERAKDEIMGVLIHEVVHCYQYDASGTCPSGLIEGIAGTHTHPHLLLAFSL